MIQLYFKSSYALRMHTNILWGQNINKRLTLLQTEVASKKMTKNSHWP